jgi:RNA polymerase sigma-70 factor (ECF subfamily)
MIVGQYGTVNSVTRLAISPSTTRVEEGTPRRNAGVMMPTFAEIYEEHFDLVWRTARRLGVPESEASDVVQDTFLVLHRRLADYDGRASIKRWVLGIVMKVVSDHRRRYRRKDAPCVPHAADSEGDLAVASSLPAPSAEVEQAEAVSLLHTLLSELDESKREVLILAQLEEMSVPEIAEVLGANVNTVYARLRAARAEFEAAHARYRARTASAASRNLNGVSRERGPHE